MIINCVLPTCRPSFIAPAITRIRAQRGCDVRVVVVENGGARGACLHQNLDADIVLWSSDSAPAARNVGLRWVKQNDPGLVSFFDDDDIYLPGHLEALLVHHARAPHGAIVGLKSHYLRTRDDRLLFLEASEATPPNTGYVLVQAMLAHSETVGFWDESLPVEEVDVAWCVGKHTVVAPPEHFAFHNGPWDHLWAPPDEEWACRMPNVFDLGQYDERIVSGEIAPSQRKRLEPSADAMFAMIDRLRQRKADGSY